MMLESKRPTLARSPPKPHREVEAKSIYHMLITDHRRKRKEKAKEERSKLYESMQARIARPPIRESQLSSKLIPRSLGDRYSRTTRLEQL